MTKRRYDIIRLLSVYVLIEAATFSGAWQCGERCNRCNERDKTCDECRYGWYGHNCEIKCNENCWVTGCDKFGLCNQCKPGRYGENCASTCPENCRVDQNNDVFCRHEGGKCLDGCKTGWWGEICNKTCSEHCDKLGCIQDNAHCIGDCSDGFWGLACDKTCQDGCRDQLCYIVTGECKNGCITGFTGEKCSQPFNCKSDNYNVGYTDAADADADAAVEDDLAKCRDGCKIGWTSESCSERCPDFCQRCHQFTGECLECPKYSYGKFCTQDCSNNCRDYECDMQGQCTRGCTDGFMGVTCEKTCPPNCLACSQNGNNCERCKTGWTGTMCQEQMLEFAIEAAFLGKAADRHSISIYVIIFSYFVWILIKCSWAI